VFWVAMAFGCAAALVARHGVNQALALHAVPPFPLAAVAVGIVACAAVGIVAAAWSLPRVQVSALSRAVGALSALVAATTFASLRLDPVAAVTIADALTTAGVVASQLLIGIGAGWCGFLLLTSERSHVSGRTSSGSAGRRHQQPSPASPLRAGAVLRTSD
jgi:fluoride ion exporter CrcB/FEX